MEWYFALVMLLGCVLVLMIVGAPIAIAFFAANIIGTFIFLRGDIGLSLMPMEYVFSIAKYSLVPVSLFILMGEILFQTGVAFRSISAIDRLISGVPGRLCMVSVAGGTVFSSLSGSTIANTAILGCETDKKGVVIDPGFEGARILAIDTLKRRLLTL